MVSAPRSTRLSPITIRSTPPPDELSAVIAHAGELMLAYRAGG